jgi:hypothetical protein
MGIMRHTTIIILQDHHHHHLKPADTIQIPDQIQLEQVQVQVRAIQIPPHLVITIIMDHHHLLHHITPPLPVHLTTKIKTKIKDRTLIDLL